MSLWRYADSIPVSFEVAARVSMGEGWTPVVPAGPDLPGVMIKLEYATPTLSFKDRGAVVLIASALERGATQVIADSSGNAGAAIAAYASRAGIGCRVFVPERTSARKQAQIAAYGAAVESVPGDRSAAAAAAQAAVERTGAVYASHVFDPVFLEGTKTFALELHDQLDELPGAVVLPVGNGTLLLGAAIGFGELQAAGRIDAAPALIGLQAERCAPLVPGAPAVDPSATAAEGIAIPAPPRAAEIREAVERTGGCLVAVPEEAILPAQRDLARRGMFVEPTAALTWAGLLLARERLEVDAAVGDWDRARALVAGRVAVPACGAGLKSI